ncbi:hypothetical protein E2C01_063172 [Portunus trituberculatus]|uniref:Uncharacterized protein n=1 Tax=Portunus trituberculatus TaxID=210409 RepID=A0A5B7HGS8_PORTR|nr:hypothetical protein [Portunus trituberculatus]
MHAHLANIVSPGSYEKELNSMLTLNNITNVKVPANPQSSKIIANIPNETQKHTEDKDIELNMEETDSEDDTSPALAIALPTQQKKTPPKEKIKIKANDIGLQIHTSKSTGWPKENLTKKKLIQGIEERKYKIIFTTQNMNATQILEAIENEELELEQCWTITDDSNFRKIRPGRTMERTPPPKPDKHRKNSLNI